MVSARGVIKKFTVLVIGSKGNVRDLKGLWFVGEGIKN
jgi:hypothetical protein